MARYFTIINGRRQYINPTDVRALKNQRAGNSVSTTGMTAAGRQILANDRKRSFAPRPATGLSYAGGGGSAANMKAEWQAAYDKARAANKARENEIRQKYKDRYSAVMQGLEGMGEQTRKDILERGKRREGEAAQSAISRGLSMGTVVDSLQNSVREGTDRSLGQLDESLRNTRLGYESSLRKEEADFLERITDQYPDQRMYAGMFEKYGQGVAGSGETGMGGGVGSSGYGGNRPMGIGHAFYTGTNPYTGLADTQKTSLRSKNFWSRRNSFQGRGKNESYADYQARRRAAGLSYRSKPVRSMQEKARIASKKNTGDVNDWLSRVTNELTSFTASPGFSVSYG